MTDPRMTPTTDAPVTVEQCDRSEAAAIHRHFWAYAEACDVENGRADGDYVLGIIARHRLAALASAPAGVNITVRQKTPVVADYGDNFLVAQVSADGKTVGIDHPCDAVWSDVDRAQTALRDYINERIAGQDKCPFKPRGVASAPAGDGVPVAWMYEKKSSVSDLVRRIVNVDRDNYAVGKGWTETALYPALARPRAAVGEREA